MLRLFGLRQSTKPLFRQAIRFQSTVETPKTVNFNKEAELELQPDLAFSVFPRIQEVQASDLVGNNSFGKGKYYVQRSHTGNLPVYLDAKNGTGVVTELRKIEGDVTKLRNDLQNNLPHIPKDNWKCVMQSNKIIIKGDFVRDVKSVLQTTF